MTQKSRQIAVAMIVLLIAGLFCSAALADVPSGSGIQPIAEDSRISPIWVWVIAAAMTGATLGVALKVSRRYNTN
jgi:hypothetical protein